MTALPDDFLRKILSSDEPAFSWRHICAFAKMRDLKPMAWIDWKASNMPCDDLLSHCIRSNSPRAFAALVDLLFIFHWQFMNEDGRNQACKKFLVAVDLADTSFRLDVVPDRAPDELRGSDEEKSRMDTENRRAILIDNVAQCIVVYLCRDPEISRKDEFEKDLAESPLMHKEFIEEIRNIYMVADIQTTLLSLQDIELGSRRAKRPQRL